MPRSHPLLPPQIVNKEQPSGVISCFTRRPTGATSMSGDPDTPTKTLPYVSAMHSRALECNKEMSAD